jgi:hypothetical protein
MAGRGGQPGNQNAAKQRLIEQAIIREIKQRDLVAGDGETLRKIAAAQIDRALDGEPFAFDRIADRLDGKPAQAITGADGGPIVIIQATALDETI